MSNLIDPLRIIFKVSEGGAPGSMINDAKTMANRTTSSMMSDAQTMGKLSSGGLNEDTGNQFLNKVPPYDELHQILDKFRNLVDTSTYANHSSVNKVTTVPSGSINVCYLWNPEKEIIFGSNNVVTSGSIM